MLSKLLDIWAWFLFAKRVGEASECEGEDCEGEVSEGVYLSGGHFSESLNSLRQ